VRVIAVLLAVLMMMGFGAQVVHEIAEVASVVDDAADPNPPVVSAPVAEPPPRDPTAAGTATLAPVHGRMHAVLVFRPPRPFASR
jgi:hypothetical protein